MGAEGCCHPRRILFEKKHAARSPPQALDSLCGALPLSAPPLTFSPANQLARFGRKRWVLLYAATYVLSCVTKHFNDYWWLMAGRVLGGVSTSLLFSVFEAWAIAEHKNRGLSDSLIGQLFSRQMFLNSIVAIISGVAGQMVASFMPNQALLGSFTVGGYCSPFDLAIASMVTGAAIANGH